MTTSTTMGTTGTTALLLFFLFYSACGRSDPVGCRNACQRQGETRCMGNTIQACVQVSKWCLAWMDLRDCLQEGGVCRLGDDGAYCSGGCNMCTAPGEARCKAKAIQVCILDEDGCLVWRDSVDCGFYGEYCTLVDGQPQCTETCKDRCAPEGSTRCSGLLIQTCLQADNDCLDWQTTGECAPDEACDDSVEPARCVCTDVCQVEGATRCDGNVIEACALRGDGCLDWFEERDCAAEGLVCADRPGLAVCEECVPDCSARECGPDPVCGVSCGDCPGETEVCRDDAGLCEDVCVDRECGTVAGIDCGDCEGETEVCRDEEGVCEEVCEWRECGVVEGVDCGTCPDDEICVTWQCLSPPVSG